MPITLEPLMSFVANLRPPLDTGPGPYGNRMFFEATDATITGPRLSGRASGGGGDWLLLGSNGIAHLDVRFVMTTDDDAIIYVHYHGILELNEKVQATLAGTEPGGWGDGYYMTSPRFETGDPRYAWLNDVVCLAEGRVLPSGVEFNVFTATNVAPS